VACCVFSLTKTSNRKLVGLDVALINVSRRRYELLKTALPGFIPALFIAALAFKKLRRWPTDVLLDIFNMFFFLIKG
jgi:hypothetical protein